MGKGIILWVKCHICFGYSMAKFNSDHITLSTMKKLELPLSLFSLRGGGEDSGVCVCLLVVLGLFLVLGDNFSVFFCLTNEMQLC
jgi:hypothetical protein